MQIIGIGPVIVRSTSRRGAGRSGMVIGSGSTELAGSTRSVACARFERWLGEQPPEAAREVALEAPQRAFLVLPSASFAREVLASGGVVLGAGDRDRV